jgi:hypothetical protein
LYILKKTKEDTDENQIKRRLLRMVLRLVRLGKQGTLGTVAGWNPLRGLPPANDRAGQSKWHHDRQLNSGGAVLAMGGWLASLAEWRRLPLWSGFAELDLQIDKLRALRDSYAASPPKHQPEGINDTKPLCTP